jgi:hypothetical protein
MENCPSNEEWAFEIGWQETAPGAGEGVLTDFQTGEQYRTESLAELLLELRRRVETLPTGEAEG